MTKKVSVTVYVWCSHCRKPIKFVLPPVFTKCGSSCLSFILSVTLLLQYQIFFPYCWFGTNYIIFQVDTSRTIGTMKLTTCSGSWTWQLDDSFLAWTGYMTRSFIMLLFFFSMRPVEIDISLCLPKVSLVEITWFHIYLLPYHARQN